MKIPILSTLFGKKKPPLQSIDSILISKLKLFAKEKGYPLFENTPIFHRSQKIDVPLLLFIPKTGVILFEYKEWSYEKLKNSSVSKVSHAKKESDSLSFESVGDFIKEKIIDLTTFDDIDIFNFVIMEQLREEEFERLDSSFHELLPKERILFNDSSLEQIERKFKALQTKPKNYTIQNTLPFIFSQYMIVDEEHTYFANDEQRAFIDKELKRLENLTGERQSGKSTLVLQKAILHKLEKPDERIAIVTPTHLQTELLKQILVEIVERSSVMLDLSDIAIYTPNELLNEHRKREKKAPLEKFLIEPFHLSKSLDIFDILFVDDAHMITNEFLEYLKHIQKEAILLLVNSLEEEETISLNKSYYGETVFIQAPEFPTLLKKINELIKEDETAEILVFTANGDYDAIKEDIEGFTAKELSTLQTDRSIREQHLTQIKLYNYDPKVSLHATYTFLIQCCDINYFTLEYLAKSSKKKSFIIYEEECDRILKLKRSLKELDAKDTQE